jgi:diadenosine tetraphosphate (Ap4A) HIT family hydrolase
MSECNCALCKEYENRENIIQDYSLWFLMFNRFPYLPGHVMLVPKRPVQDMMNLTEYERNEMILLITNTQNILIKALESTGVTSCNIGINIGPHSGGSIPTHLHVHLVPRRMNDTNFMHSCTFSGEGLRRDPIMFNGMYENARKCIINAFSNVNSEPTKTSKTFK